MRPKFAATIITLSVGLLFLSTSPGASAATLTMRYTGLLTGELNGVPFESKPFVISGSYDTADIAPFPTYPDTVLYAPLSDVQFEIADVGAVAFLRPTALFSNNSGIAGWTRLFGSQGDLINTVNPFFETWGMGSPVPRTFAFTESTFPNFVDYPTSGGPLTLEYIYQVHLEVVPEPSTLAMLLAAVPLGYFTYRRSR